MSSYYPLIIALVYLAIHVISIIAKEAAKRRERERQRQEAERRRMEEAGFKGPMLEPSIAADVRPGTQVGPSDLRPQPTPWPERTTSNPTPSSRLDALAAKRREQLEELRARRTGRRVGTPTQQQSPWQRGTGQPDVVRRSGTPVPQEHRQDADMRQARLERERRERERREREKARERAERQARTQRQREAAAKPKKTGGQAPPQLKPSVQVAAATTSIAESEAAQPGDRRVNKKLERIRERLQERNALQEIVFLNEVLAPPLGLRQPGA